LSKTKGKARDAKKGNKFFHSVSFGSVNFSKLRKIKELV
jgi:hypothetical protein